MRLESWLQRVFGLTASGWQRHANPWSVASRIPGLPVIAMAIWSRVWIGPWAWLALALVVVWLIINPRVFPVPRRTDNWASRGVEGERHWMRRHARPLPAHHRVVPQLTVCISLVGVALMAWGLYSLDPWPTVTGVVLGMLGKLWFLDRMVWLRLDLGEPQ